MRRMVKHSRRKSGSIAYYDRSRAFCLWLVLFSYALTNTQSPADSPSVPLEQRALTVFLANHSEARSVLDLAKLERGLFDLSNVYRVAGETPTYIFGAAALRLPETGVPEQRDIIRRTVTEHCRLVAVCEAVAIRITPDLQSQFLILNPHLAKSLARYVSTRRLSAFVEQRYPAQVQIIDGIACLLVRLDKDSVSSASETALNSTSREEILADFSSSATVQGYRLLSSGNHDDALTHFQFAEKADPNAPSTLPGLLACYVRAGRYDDFTNLASARMSRHNLSPSILRQAGKVCEDANQFDLALRFYTSALQKAPQDAQLEVCLVRLYVRLTTMDRLAADVSQSPAPTRKEDDNAEN
jgi:hypothetical protein